MTLAFLSPRYLGLAPLEVYDYATALGSRFTTWNAVLFFDLFYQSASNGVNEDTKVVLSKRVGSLGSRTKGLKLLMPFRTANDLTVGRQAGIGAKIIWGHQVVLEIAYRGSL